MKDCRVLIHAHFFYPEIAPEIAGCCRNFIEVCGAERVTIIATYPTVKPEFAAFLPKLLPYPDVKIIETPNRGYDIGAFVCEVLNKIPLEDYDYIVKLHTKRDVDGIIGFRPIYGSEWRRKLLEFCASPEKVSESLAAFTRHPKLGLLASSRFINYASSNYRPISKKEILAKLKTFGLTPSHPIAVSGTIFMVRAALLTSFVKRFTWDDFLVITSQNAHKELAIAGELELAFVYSIPAQGYAVTEGRYPLALAKLGYHCCAFLFFFMRFTIESANKLFGEERITRLKDRASNLLLALRSRI